MKKHGEGGGGAKSSSGQDTAQLMSQVCPYMCYFCLVHRMQSFPLFLEWHRIETSKCAVVIKRLLIFQVNILREEIQSLTVRPAMVVTSAAKSGQCLFMVSGNDMHCTWLFL